MISKENGGEVDFYNPNEATSFERNAELVEGRQKIHRRKNPALEDVMEYRNENVIYGFMLALDVSREEAEDIFTETLRWLWFCSHPDSDKARVIDTPLLIIDEMWHTFILYTVDYAKFCIKYFGGYLHHAPTTKEEKEKYAAMSREEAREAKARELSVKYDLLGEEVFVKWYYTYPDKFNSSRIRELRKK